MAPSTTKPPLHSLTRLRRRHFNRLFAAVYVCAILTLFYHHAHKLLNCTTTLSFFISLTMLIADAILGYMWSTVQVYRMNPVTRQEFPENLEKILETKDFPPLDIFICTADPYREPPINVVNTALSVMAYDYPTEKLSVYVSDDGGSELTLFAFMEAAKFARLWLPFCRENGILERSPDAYFKSNYGVSPKTEEIKIIYDRMKTKIENVLERGKLNDLELEHQIFSQWTKDFTRQDHPSIVELLIDASKDMDIGGYPMPNLIYVTREKCEGIPHHFKAGALNVLLRISAIMTNAPIILTLDCDMYSHDPITARRALCYLIDKSSRPNFGYLQFPQLFHGLNKADIYAGELKRSFQINPVGMDGLSGPNHVGTGCFFYRRVFFGGPSSFVEPENPKLSPYRIVNKTLIDHEVLHLARQLAGCNYEKQTNWGSKIGFRYGSIVEDFYTGYILQCEGWTSIFCHPKRPAFLGDVPISLNDVLNQSRRWTVGLLEVGFSKYSPLTFGISSMGILMGQGYALYAFWAIWSFPITVYAFLPSFTLLSAIPIFAKVSDPWFFLYAFLCLGAYGQDCLDFVLAEGTLRRWWSDQRMWHIRATSSYLFGLIEFIMKRLGIATHKFNLTSKVMLDEQSKRYDQGIFEFGVPSPMFVPLATAAIINLIAFLSTLPQIVWHRNFDIFFMQMFVSGFVVLLSLPVYEAMILRVDKGRIPTKITAISTLLAGGFCLASSLIVKK